MKKIFLIAIILAVFGLLVITFYPKPESDIISHLTGKVYYTKRDDQVLNLYTANADFTNRKLVYAHQGEENNNIIDFYFDEDSGLIYFVAMEKQEWSLFSIDEGEDKPHYIKSYNGLAEWKDFLKHYLKAEYQDKSLINKKGSLYLVSHDKEEILKKFYGFYDSKFNSGYVPIGFSPDGQYVIYHSTEHFTPIGTLIESIFDHDYSLGQNYIMDLETKKVETYPTFHNLQWVIN